MNKASGGDGIPVELFQMLKDDAVKVLHSICQQNWKMQLWPQNWKRSHEFKKTAGDSEGQKPGVRQSLGSERVRHDLATEHQSYKRRALLLNSFVDVVTEA